MTSFARNTNYALRSIFVIVAHVKVTHVQTCQYTIPDQTPVVASYSYAYTKNIVYNPMTLIVSSRCEFLMQYMCAYYISN